jgi:hypothetical protein
MSAMRSLTPVIEGDLPAGRAAALFVGALFGGLELGDHQGRSLGILEGAELGLQRQAQVLGDGQEVLGNRTPLSRSPFRGHPCADSSQVRGTRLVFSRCPSAGSVETQVRRHRISGMSAPTRSRCARSSSSTLRHCG